MSQVINTNVMSLNAQRNLSTSGGALATALQRLSSGLRINSAKDDAAGLAISSRFTTQINGLNQAVRNASDGISLAQTTEGALSEVGNNLQRIRELAVQAANSTNSASDRAALDAEVQQRIAEIDRVAAQTSFNGLKVLDGTFGTGTFQVGANVGETISLSLSTSVRATAIGKTADYVGGAAYNANLAVGQQGAGVNGTALSAGALTITVGTGQAVNVVAATAGSGAGQTTASAYAKAAAINSSGISGVTATADTTAQYNLGATAGVAIASTETDYDLTINGVAIYSNFAAGGTAVTADQFVSTINANSASTGVVASYDSSNSRLTLTASDGRNIAITQGSTTVASDGAAQGIGATEGTNNSSNSTTLANATGASTSVTLVGSVRLVSAEQIAVGGTPALIGYSAGSLALGSSALNSASVTTVANANTTIGRVDAALTTVNNLRGNLGAIQNRFESTIASLSASVENQTASRSRILDADYAAETAALTRAQILQQAGTAILSQANSAPQSVLSLLR